MTHPRITVVSSANIDLTFRTPRFPLPGETLTGHSLHQCMSGKGANQAVAAARLGADVTFIACVGRDVFGKAALEGYEADGIRTRFTRQVEKQPTGTAAILVDDKAENCIIVVAGANALLKPADVNAALSKIQQSEVVLCQLETPTDAAVTAFRIARAANVLTVLTPAPAVHVADELLNLCDICVPNKTEIATLTGQSIHHQSDVLLEAEKLCERGVKRVALTMGSEGVLLLDESGATHVPAISVDTVDTTGVGDDFTAALAVSRAEGKTFLDAARSASIVAAISVTRLNTQTAFPTKNEVIEWLTMKEIA